jgi:hypothetical protein
MSSARNFFWTYSPIVTLGFVVAGMFAMATFIGLSFSAHV